MPLPRAPLLVDRAQEHFATRFPAPGLYVSTDLNASRFQALHFGPIYDYILLVSREISERNECFCFTHCLNVCCRELIAVDNSRLHALQLQ